MIDREEILHRAYNDCMREMYAKAQPEADWDNLLEEYREGKIGKDELIYERHYLSTDEFLYIRDKYKEAYNIKKTWIPNIEFLEQLLNEGGLKDKYIPEQTDEDGFVHPGYRSAEDVKPIVDQIGECLTKYMLSNIADDVAKEVTNIVMNTIKNYKDFYKFDRESDDFDKQVALGPSPIANPETVKQWWKNNYNQDVEIEEHNPKLFWYRDNDYTDEDLKEEFDSENWKEIVDKEWEEEKAAERRKHEEVIKELENDL